MQPKKLSILTYICLIALLVTKPVVSYADGIKSEMRLSTRALQDWIDSLQTSDKPSNVRSDFGVSGVIRLGLGNHDNLTKATSMGEPKLKTSNFYWNPYVEAGLIFKSASGNIFVSGVFPIPRAKTDGGYKHEGDLNDMGLLFRVRLLSFKSPLNLSPIAGYRWLNERARIFDPQGLIPDSLNLKNTDHGPFYGAETQFTFLRLSHENDFRLIFTYVHENLRKNNVNKFRLEVGLFAHSIKKNAKGKDYLDSEGFVSLGFEHLGWSNIRRDWFFLISLGLWFKG